MPLMNVRFVITGACFVGYSGKQLQLEVPVTQPNGSRTTVADVEAQVRSEWPAEFSEMSESIKTIEMRILKTGRLLKGTDVFEQQLTKSELAECEVPTDAGKTAEEIERSSILMHLVFQKEQKEQPKKKTDPQVPSPASGGAAASNTGNGNSNVNNNNNNNASANPGGRDAKGDTCCSVM